MRIGLVAVGIATASVAASAQERPPRPSPRFSRSVLERLVQETSQGPGTVRLSQSASTRSGRRRDSILNGGLIGAAVGGVGGSALIVAASGGSDDFRGAMVKVAPWTALAGFGAGALIDALR